MVAGLGPFALLVRRRLPFVVEIFAERPAFGIEEMAAEQVDDARRAAQICAVAGHRMPGEERFQQMHMRVGAPQLLAVRRLQEAGQADVLEMGVEEGERLARQRQRIRDCRRDAPAASASSTQEWS